MPSVAPDLFARYAPGRARFGPICAPASMRTSRTRQSTAATEARGAPAPSVSTSPTSRTAADGERRGRGFYNEWVRGLFALAVSRLRERCEKLDGVNSLPCSSATISPRLATTATDLRSDSRRPRRPDDPGHELARRRSPRVSRDRRRHAARDLRQRESFAPKHARSSASTRVTGLSDSVVARLRDSSSGRMSHRRGTRSRADGEGAWVSCTSRATGAGAEVALKVLAHPIVS